MRAKGDQDSDDQMELIPYISPMVGVLSFASFFCGLG